MRARGIVSFYNDLIMIGDAFFVSNTLMCLRENPLSMRLFPYVHRAKRAVAAAFLKFFEKK